MTQVILGKSRVREICMPGSVRAKAEWLSYSTNSEIEAARSSDVSVSSNIMIARPGSYETGGYYLDTDVVTTTTSWPGRRPMALK